MSELKHYGVKGMKWGVRKDKFANKIIETNRKHYTKQYQKYVDRGEKKANDLMVEYGKTRIKETNELFDKAKKEYDRTRSLRSVTDANRYAEADRIAKSFGQYKKLKSGKITEQQIEMARNVIVGYSYSDFLLGGSIGGSIIGIARSNSISKMNAARKNAY